MKLSSITNCPTPHPSPKPLQLLETVPHTVPRNMKSTNYHSGPVLSHFSIKKLAKNINSISNLLDPDSSRCCKDTGVHANPTIHVIEIET